MPGTFSIIVDICCPDLLDADFSAASNACDSGYYSGDAMSADDGSCCELLAEVVIPILDLAGDPVLGRHGVHSDEWLRMQRLGSRLRAFEDPHVHITTRFEPAPLIIEFDCCQHSAVDMAHDHTRAYNLLREGFFLHARTYGTPEVQLEANTTQFDNAFQMDRGDSVVAAAAHRAMTGATHVSVEAISENAPSTATCVALAKVLLQVSSSSRATPETARS
eukprot:SAG31_NODE_737_length_12474_cov_14.694303_7_plen_220_part_00